MSNRVRALAGEVRQSWSALDGYQKMAVVCLNLAAACGVGRAITETQIKSTPTQRAKAFLAKTTSLDSDTIYCNFIYDKSLKRLVIAKTEDQYTSIPEGVFISEAGGDSQQQGEMLLHAADGLVASPGNYDLDDEFNLNVAFAINGVSIETADVFDPGSDTSKTINLKPDTGTTGTIGFMDYAIMDESNGDLFVGARCDQRISNHILDEINQHQS